MGEFPEKDAYYGKSHRCCQASLVIDKVVLQHRTTLALPAASDPIPFAYDTALSFTSCSASPFGLSYARPQGGSP